MFGLEYLKPTYDLVRSIFQTGLGIERNLHAVLGRLSLIDLTLSQLIDKSRVYFECLLGEQRSPLVAGGKCLANFRKGPIVMRFQLTATQYLVLTPKFVDKKGNAAKPDGVPTWGSDNSDVLQLTVGTLTVPGDPTSFVETVDGGSCKVSAIGPLTHPELPVMVTVQADADLGDGVTLILGTAKVDVVAGNIVTVELEGSAPAEQT